MESQSREGLQCSNKEMMNLDDEKKELQDNLLEIQKEMIDLNGEKLLV